MIVKAVHLAELCDAVNAVCALPGKGTFPFTDVAAAGLTIKAVHVTELRSALDDALSASACQRPHTPTPHSPASRSSRFLSEEIRDRLQ